MKNYLVGFYYSLPVQLFLLHCRRYQVLLVFWYILFAVINGTFLKAFGAYSLYLSPEYMGEVNPLSAAMVGVSIGIFVMSWNITTFILHGKHLRFLATTANPFLKYCINNAIIPVVFLLFYLVKAFSFNRYQQLYNVSEVLWLIAGFALGLLSSILVAFVYFFGADKSIYRGVASVIDTANKKYIITSRKKKLPPAKTEMRVDWFLSAHFRLRKPRDTRHYSEEFLETIFKSHHIAAIISIGIAILFLLFMGFFLDNPIFQIPAAASSTLFFSILISVAGAFTLFLKNWSLAALAILFLGLNFLVRNDLIDLRNKAYGLDYGLKKRPVYSKETIAELASAKNVAADKKEFIKILDNWKMRQVEEKPVMYLVNVSGGGNRSATFTMDVMQHLDSLTNGNFMRRTLMISGASGGMLGAAYFREMYYRRQQGEAIQLQDQQYVDNIARDLLNPLFSSFIARDITSPAQRFSFNGKRYIKDRGYAFERKLDDNTNHFLNKQLKDYLVPEQQAQIPVMFFNSTITRDGRRMMIGAQPVRFMMKPVSPSSATTVPNADIIDFVSLFKDMDPQGLSILSALRMNATFPYVLPNVWLPTTPVIDVMDAGLRDNFGIETTLRLVDVFKDWIIANTSKVVIIDIRDRVKDDWEVEEVPTVLSWLTKPLTLMQSNWFKIQDYNHANQLSYVSTSMPDHISQVTFQYVPLKKEKSASLSFHLTNAEKIDIQMAKRDPINQQSFQKLMELTPNTFRLQELKALR